MNLRIKLFIGALCNLPSTCKLIALNVRLNIFLEQYHPLPQNNLVFVFDVTVYSVLLT